MTLPDPGTDPVEEPSRPPSYGFWATLVGMPQHDRRMDRKFARLERLLTANAADLAALEAARATLTAADQTIDNIERTQP